MGMHTDEQRKVFVVRDMAMSETALFKDCVMGAGFLEKYKALIAFLSVSKGSTGPNLPCTD